MKLSVVIPTLGRETLWWTLDSLLGADDYLPETVEILVVFSGKKIPKRATDYPSVHFLEEPKPGASAARNRGIDTAQGELLAFLGDDTAPEKDWILRTLKWHEDNPGAGKAAVGMVAWAPHLQDDFHAWLLDHAQFSFAQMARRGANWRHFYTANLSLKRAFLAAARFDTAFTAWGFEDAELSYRLAKRGLALRFVPAISVLHDHPQTLESVLRNTKSARENAALFEQKHPEVRLLPRGWRRVLLLVCVRVGALLPLREGPFRWWIAWKRAWLGLSDS